MDQEGEFSKMFVDISLVYVWQVLEWFLVMQNSFKFLSHLESKTNQFEIIVFKSLACFST